MQTFAELTIIGIVPPLPSLTRVSCWVKTLFHQVIFPSSHHIFDMARITLLSLTHHVHVPNYDYCHIVPPAPLTPNPWPKNPNSRQDDHPESDSLLVWWDSAKDADLYLSFPLMNLRWLSSACLVPLDVVFHPPSIPFICYVSLIIVVLYQDLWHVHGINMPLNRHGLVDQSTAADSRHIAYSSVLWLLIVVASRGINRVGCRLSTLNNEFV